jgi:hypothetical protein
MSIFDPSGAVTSGTLWYNTTSNSLFIYNAVSPSWYRLSMGYFFPQWLPTSYPKYLWLDATDNQFIEPEGNIFSWSDKSGNGKNFSATLAAPTYDSINRFVTFNGNQSMICPTATITSGPTGFPTNPIIWYFSVWSVGRDQTAIYQSVFEQGTSLSTNQSYRIMGYGTGTGIPTNGYGLNTLGVSGIPSPPGGFPRYTTNVPMVSAIGITSGGASPNIRNRHNGLDVSSQNISLPSVVFNNVLTYLGQNSSGAERFTGAIGEIMIIKATLANPLTNTDIQKIEGYLAWKWRIQGFLPVGHPYRTTPPT